MKKSLMWRVAEIRRAKPRRPGQSLREWIDSTLLQAQKEQERAVEVSRELAERKQANSKPKKRIRAKHQAAWLESEMK